MKRVLASAFTALVLAASGVAATSATASAAPDGARAFRCSLAWNDNNTAGVKCTGGGSFIGVAECKNGRTAQGAKAAAGTTSYAYCTSVNSSLKKPINAWGIRA
ncbi:hypothetical protein G5C60_24355 [Streptomyces sp. HC44]|uniref:Uncharacterized protein n=1 Tax=Streptomyces scabichelini TaxID=2711217 RepID=A0A6G4VA05_9ACTN|nr:hypothetical protein [Streptomyces scabichelini]NGO10643.1 hypothetical protein [Streptomyces scabichelini]